MKKTWEYHLRLDLRNEEQEKVYEVLRKAGRGQIRPLICRCILEHKEAEGIRKVMESDLQSLKSRVAALEHAAVTGGENASRETNAETVHIGGDVDDLLSQFFDNGA